MIITISRQYATNGILIGRMVGDQLGVPVYDRELVEDIARRMQVSPHIVHNLPANLADSVRALLLEWRTSITPEIYVRYLRAALRQIADQGGAVIVGGGANFVLREQDTLHVRIIAPIELRSAIFRAGNDLTDTAARKIIAERDKLRKKFIRATFHRNVDDAQYYHLVLNLAGLTPEMAAEEIIHAAHLRKAAHLETHPEVTMPHHLRMMVKARHHVRPEIIEALDATSHGPTESLAHLRTGRKTVAH